MTRFAYEVPLAHLEDFEEYQDIHFALSFLCRKEKRYFDYMKSMVGKKKVILDNSFNELGEPDEPEEMAKTFHLLEADMVVSPDSDDWPLDRMSWAYNKMLDYCPRERVLAVIRNKEEFEWYREAGGYNFCTTFYHRPSLQENIKNFCYHFLGLVNPQEINRYSPISCDTSMPIKLALQNLRMLDWIEKGCPHIHTKDIPDFFYLTLTKEQLRLAKENCQWIKRNLSARVAP